MVFPLRRSIEVVITALTRNQVVRKGSWVRIPPSPPIVSLSEKECAYRGVAQMVALLNGVQEAAGSTPVTPTNEKHEEVSFFVFFILRRLLKSLPFCLSIWI